MTPSVVGVTAPAATTIGGIPLDHRVTYNDKQHERQLLKEKLAAAFRIFAKYGFDEGVGTLRFMALLLQLGALLTRSFL